MFRGMFALALALGLMAGTTFAKEDVREEVAPAPAAAAAVHEHAHACPDWHCAQGGGAHFNLAKPKSCEKSCHSACSKGCGDGCDKGRTCGQWHKCGETHVKGDHHHQYGFWHGWFRDDCHHHCNEKGACGHGGWFQCGHRHLTPAEQTTRLP